MIDSLWKFVELIDANHFEGKRIGLDHLKSTILRFASDTSIGSSNRTILPIH